MSLHRSLKTKPAALNQHRNVLTRAERIEQLTAQEDFTPGESSPIALVKVANRQVVTKKKKKEDESGEGEAGGEAAASESTES
jgi:small basic protein (TIGR04137 family)